MNETREKLPFELQAGETILVHCRRHWMYFWPKVAGMGLLAVAGLVVFTWVVAATAGLDGTAGLIVLAVDALWAAYWLVRGYFTWYRYQHDIWVVTNQRIVDSLRRHWFHHQMASADLVDVEDMAVHRQGLLPTAFNFGDLRCQTAGSRPNFILAGIPDPSRILGVVDASRDAARRELVRPPGQ